MADIRPQNIHQSIEAMTALLSKQGIAKEQGKTREISYLFRGIDDIRNALAPLQKECSLNIIPKVVSREEKERTTKNGGFALWVVLNMEFVFKNTVDGSYETVPWIAEAVDYSDKATQKAISQGFKTVCINIFNIPTEGEEDTDGEKKEFRAQRTGVFETDDMRRVWVANCRLAFEQQDSALKLKDCESAYHEKLLLMGASKDPEDVKAASDLRAVYNTRLSELSKPKVAL